MIPPDLRDRLAALPRATLLQILEDVVAPAVAEPAGADGSRVIRVPSGEAGRSLAFRFSADDLRL